MSLTPEELTATLDSLRRGQGVFRCRALLENYFIEELEHRPLSEICALITALPNFEFAPEQPPSQVDTLIIRSHDEGIPIVIELMHSEMAMSANVDVLRQAEPLDPKFNSEETRFYQTWETIIQGDFDKGGSGQDEWELAVALVGLFESELMNGGIGQYLSNSDGRYLSETLQTLKRIGAREAARILAAAEALRAEDETYDDLWDAQSDTLASLDDAFLAAGENLASLTARYFGR